ncbi:ABC transporter ATP-binding protein [Flavobacterium lacus]|jgi:lipopolysaccharide transport system ATP-binding protein|uniref:Lipopolysaccharide transport system ATP-binding protein n=1 Tax=Flavobacterium lacus TaxID=1353778 RepID=A0A328WK43_9FLAO|nr:ABC transporter ATP-binding protein [Flavobacterium lacus]RAR46600.1 lipopolysaccharide transport system ATP-binding protein [Flavobacterium lacus]
MSTTILKVQNISKQYRLGKIGTGTLSHDLNRWWHTVRGKEDPYLKIGEANDRSVKGNSQYVLALQDISFEVKQGEVLGIIGKNGAGKSTLLKILSRVTAPSTGTIKTRGRIASLLEVGTGFHPEMTGRENIYLNGAILGMTKKEIDTKLEEIIDFSGCERYIDTPVKRYSSGMTVRLAFAVAAHLEPEILVVDEVLAVGDAEFQKKAIGKMQDISKGEGRTVLFVSHNMAAVKSLCTRAVVIKNGMITFDGGVDDAIQFYLKESTVHTAIKEIKERKGSGIIKIIDVEVFGNSIGILPQTGQPFHIEFALSNPKGITSNQMRFDLRIDDHMGQRIAWMSDSVLPKQSFNTSQRVQFMIPKLNLNHGLYYVTTHISVNNEVSDWIQNAFSFEVTEGDYYGSGKKTPAEQSKTLLDYNVNYL